MYDTGVCVCITCMPGTYGSQKRVLNPLKLELQMVLSHLYDTHVTGTHGGQKRELDSLELELQKVISCLVGAENPTQVLCRNSQSFLTIGHLSSPLV